MTRPLVLALALLLAACLVTPSVATQDRVAERAVAVYVVGVDDPVARARMQADVAALLVRNRVVVDPEHGIPLTLTLERPAGAVATWRVALDACDGRSLGRARFASALPANAAALVAAISSRLPEVRGWLVDAAE